MLDRKLLKNIDWVLWGTMLAISLFSVVVLRSAGAAEIPGDDLFYAKRQLIWILVGNLFIAGTLFFDYRSLTRLTRLMYVGNLGLLAAVLVVGVTRGGAQRWIPIGGFPLQPSEFAKVIIIIVFAHYMEHQGQIKTLKDLIWAGLVIAIPMGLILIQPDLGTSLVFIVVFFGILFAAGTPAKYLLGMLATGIAASPAVWFFGLKAYQRDRLLVFLNPESPVYRSKGGYQIIQSIIAIGSGGLLGQGWMRGTQNVNNFLPEQHTDFIFAVIGEEFGFIGTTLVVAAFFFMMLRMVQIALNAKDPFGRYMTVGVVVLMLFQVFVNVGMTAGIMPVTGLPLPFITYGGSSYLTFSAAMALVLNVGMRRHKILF